MTDTQPQPARGGARAGAGRKPKYPGLGKTKDVGFQIPESLADWLNAAAKDAGLSRSEWLTQKLKRMKARTK